MSTKHPDDQLGRRTFLRAAGSLAAGSLAATPLLGGIATKALAQTDRVTNGPRVEPAARAAPGRRRLGRLEVSSIGIGVQNMSRRYETTVPYRP